jgi:hypothetical protein
MIYQADFKFNQKHMKYGSHASIFIIARVAPSAAPHT